MKICMECCHCKPIKDCILFISGIDMSRYSHCSRGELQPEVPPPNPVNGDIDYPGMPRCSDMRGDEKKCGIEGKYWQAKKPSWWQRIKIK